MHVFYAICHSSGFIAYLDLPSRQNTQRAGHICVFLVCHFPFSIEGYPMSCLWYSVILHPLLLSGCESSFQAEIKRGDRRLRLGFYLRSWFACFHRRLSQNTKNEACSYFILWQFMIDLTSGSCDLQTCCEYPSNCLLFCRIVNSYPKTNHLNLIKLDVGEHCWS